MPFATFKGLVVACMIGGQWQQGTIVDYNLQAADDAIFLNDASRYTDGYLVKWDAGYRSAIHRNRCILRDPPAEIQSTPMTPAERRAWLIKYNGLLRGL